MEKNCWYVDKPCGDQPDTNCEPGKYCTGKMCFPTADEYVEHWKIKNPAICENQVRRWYANERRGQISFYSDKPLT